MPETNSEKRICIAHLILIPSIITLVITIVRLMGELQHWPKPWFSASAGGGGAIIGISWLPFIFGPYFALKLAGLDKGPSSNGKAIGMAILGLMMMFAGGFIGFAPKPAFPGKIIVGLLLIAAAPLLQIKTWPTLFKTLLAYGYAARIPVAIVMYFAIKGSWGTHYDALPPNYAGPTDFWGLYIFIGLIPQLIMWPAFTVIVGSLFGSIAAAVAHRGKPAIQAAS